MKLTTVNSVQSEVFKMSPIDVSFEKRSRKLLIIVIIRHINLIIICRLTTILPLMQRKRLKIKCVKNHLSSIWKILNKRLALKLFMLPAINN